MGVHFRLSSAELRSVLPAGQHGGQPALAIVRSPLVHKFDVIQSNQFAAATHGGRFNKSHTQLYQRKKDLAMTWMRLVRYGEASQKVAEQ